ncbi:unnamed protein product [Somion occarium]|uniref:Transcriptional coactivator p15 (PC4) C-terminal domain-containing protein n=1 Tax=Somion occarium TaxID=3059160 RepID=A0ABP1DK18_9APHY
MAKRPVLASSESEEFEESSAAETSESEPVKKPSKSAPKRNTRASKSKKRSETEDEDEDEDEEEEKPAPKKQKLDKGKVKAVKKSSSNEPKEDETDGSAIRTDKDGSKYVELGKKRRAAVREFKGVVYLDIREFYEKGGEELPGKKGISLNLEQWEALKQNAHTIDSLFAKKK